MAKDKTKKDKASPEKASKKTSAPVEDDDEFAAPESDIWKITEADGGLLLVYPQSIEFKATMHSTTAAGDECIRARVVVIDEKKPAKSEVHNDVLIFQGVLIGNLRGAIPGKKKVLGRLGRGEASKGKSAPWILNAPTEDDKGVARAYLASVDPLA